jgi:hypothetical protein
MKITSNKIGSPSLAVVRGAQNLSRGEIGVFISRLRPRILPGTIGLFNLIRLATSSFTALFQASTAMIMHKDRYTYFINEADFSFGKFAKKDYLGTKDLGWDRFDGLFPRELESTVPKKVVIVPNINADVILTVDKEGDVIGREHDREKVEALVFDRKFQTKGSIMLVPLIPRDVESTPRAMVYLYSPETDHFSLPETGYAAHLLAGTVALTLQTLI